MAPFIFQTLSTQPMAWDADRVRAIRESLGLDDEAFAALVGITPQTVYWWESGRGSPRSCTKLLLLLLETYGPPMQDLMSSVAADDVWDTSRIRAVREALGMSLSDFAELLDIAVGNARVLEQKGWARSECYAILFGLLETFPYEMISRIKGLPKGA